MDGRSNRMADGKGQPKAASVRDRRIAGAIDQINQQAVRINRRDELLGCSNHLAARFDGLFELKGHPV